MMSASNRAGVLDEVSRPDWHTDPPFGSVAWEAWNFRKRGGEITYDAFAHVPPDTPGAVHFPQSLIILDEDGKRIRSELDADGTDFSESPISTAFC
jgi:hypothetical protein